MLNDFERKLSRIIKNYLVMHSDFPTLSQLEQWTGHNADEIQKTFEKLMEIPNHDGGLFGYSRLPK